MRILSRVYFLFNVFSSTARSACEAAELQKTFLEGDDPSEQTSALCLSFAKLPGSVIIIIKANYILCHITSQLTKQP